MIIVNMVTKVQISKCYLEGDVRQNMHVWM